MDASGCVSVAGDGAGRRAAAGRRAGRRGGGGVGLLAGTREAMCRSEASSGVWSAMLRPRRPLILQRPRPHHRHPRQRARPYEASPPLLAAPPPPPSSPLPSPLLHLTPYHLCSIHIQSTALHLSPAAALHALTHVSLERGFGGSGGVLGEGPSSRSW